VWDKKEGRPATVFWVDIKGWGYRTLLIMDNFYVNSEMEADLLKLISAYFKNIGLKGAFLGFETQHASIREEVSGGDITSVYVEDSLHHVRSNVIIASNTPKWEIFGKALESMTNDAQFVEFLQDTSKDHIVADIMVTADTDTEKVVLGVISGKANIIRMKALVSTLPKSKWGKVRATSFKASDNYNNLTADDKYYLDYEDMLEDLSEIIKSRMDEDGRVVLSLRPDSRKTKMLDIFKSMP